MKSLNTHINESIRNKYDIYFHSKKKAIAITSLGDKNPQLDEEKTYETIDDAVKAIYSIDPICDIQIIPYQKLTDYILSK